MSEFALFALSTKLQRSTGLGCVIKGRHYGGYCRALWVSLLCVLVMALTSFPAQASLFDRAGSDGPLPVDEAYRFSGGQLANGLYRLHWQIEDDYYLYRDKIKLTPDQGIELVEVRYPESKQKQDPLFGEVAVYYNDVELLLRVQSGQTAAIDGNLKVQYQGCWEGGICYPPVKTSLPLTAVPPQAPDFDSITADDAAPATTTTSVSTSVSKSAAAGFELSLTDPRQYIDKLAGGNLLLTLGLFFIAGLALSLTPCVFPMVPILAGVIAGQGEKITSRKALLLSVVYVLSMSLTYTLIGVLAGVFGGNLQASFQNPWIISAFSGLFVLLSLAMFGFYELQIPTALQNKLNMVSRSQHGGNLLGVAIMGLLSALIVGPCVAAPLAGALVYIGQTGDPLLGGLALFTLSMGMGLPLILVGVSAGKILPRAGSWMNTVKQVFGVALLLMAVWMLDRIVPSSVTLLLLAVVLVTSAVFLRALDRLSEAAGAISRLGKALGLLLLIYGGMLLVAVATGQGTLLKPLQGFAGGTATTQAAVTFTKVTSIEQLDPLLEQAQLQQSPVMLDFYADWCVSCKELEVFTFADSQVIDQLNRFVTIKVDVTAHDDAAKALYQRYGIVGPPALVFYDKAGQLSADAMLVGVPDPDDFVGHLAKF
ncbi:MAG: protein-disulfide reductase DsbD [Motiliproteus sp.]